jgi:hypothetical protein
MLTRRLRCQPQLKLDMSQSGHSQSCRSLLHFSFFVSPCMHTVSSSKTMSSSLLARRALSTAKSRCVLMSASTIRYPVVTARATIRYPQTQQTQRWLSMSTTQLQQPPRFSLDWLWNQVPKGMFDLIILEHLSLSFTHLVSPPLIF